MAARVTLSSRLTDQDHTRPVVQGLRDLAGLTNGTAERLDALAARVAAIQVPSLAQIRNALQASGSAPLNITALIPGGKSGTGAGQVLTGTHGDRLALPVPQVGTLYIETDRYAVYLYSITGWSLLGNLLGPLDVTLSPDTKPSDLGLGDVGFTVWATDYAREYIWTGAAWGEDNHNPARYQLGMFAAAPDQAGWFLCDGGTVVQSKLDGTTANYVTPDLITANRFLRAANAAGGTGDTSTHHHSVDPPFTLTGTASTTATVDDDGLGSTISVVRADAVFGVDIAAFNSADTQALPPWFDALPYIRL